MSAPKCAGCGRYTASDRGVLMEGEVGDGVWLECIDCMSLSDLRVYFPELAAARATSQDERP